ncbi:MAG: DUF4230 domain-containing protein [candidate division WOR-3 bacterium]|jgi:hypothetical protein
MLNRFFIFIFLLACKKEIEEISLKNINNITNLNIAEYVIRSVFEIRFPKMIGENKFLIEVQGKVRFCVNLSDIKFKDEGEYVIFYNVPKPKVCSYSILDSLLDYDEDISLMYMPFSNNDRKLAFKLAIDSLRNKIEKLSNDSLIQRELNNELKKFLIAFVRNFSKDVKFE